MRYPAAAFSIPANCEAHLAIRAGLPTFARKARRAGMFPFASRASLARPACLAQISRTTTKEGAADVGALGGQRERFPHRNMRAKLPNYIGQVFECKAGRTHCSQRLITHRRTGPDLLCLFLWGCLVCVVKPDKPNKPINQMHPCRSLTSSCFP
mgnify:FL=1